MKLCRKTIVSRGDANVNYFLFFGGEFPQNSASSTTHEMWAGASVFCCLGDNFERLRLLRQGKFLQMKRVILAFLLKIAIGMV